MLTNKDPKTPIKFTCEKCIFKCNKKSEWDRHLATRKHNSLTVLTEKTRKTPEHICSQCLKIYKSREGLWFHLKKCTFMKEPPIATNTVINSHEEVKNLTTLVMELMKSNTELQKQMVDICKNNNTTNNNINSHNKTFNLQFFLNEQCKDAMNISDFANSFDLQLSDLESVGELGYVEGITKIMVDKLNSMDIYKRPIHCSDAKRETLYVKDDNKWEKETRNNPKLRYVIKTISFRNMKLAALWSDTYPESNNSDSHMNDVYINIIKESTGGNGEISLSEDKIIRRIAKEIVIDK